MLGEIWGSCKGKAGGGKGEAKDKGILEVRRRISEDETRSWMCLDICREGQETAQKLQREIKKTGTEVRRFRAEKNGGGLCKRRKKCRGLSVSCGFMK